MGSSLVPALIRAFSLALVLIAVLPAAASAHVITERYQAPLPLAAYVAGAAIAVAMSFAFVMLRNPAPAAQGAPEEARRVPWAVRLGLRSIGLLAWIWIVAQTIVGGAGQADVASLFLWVYGWVGVALVSALIGPIWPWLDPFRTLHMVLSWLGSRLKLRGTGQRDYPPAWSIWPAILGFAAVIWLELVAHVDGGRMLGLLLIGYTLYTLAGMLLFGREQWSNRAEIFSVWFGVLGRLAPFELIGEPEEGLVRRRPFGAGLAGGWSRPELVLIALGTASIIFDGLSQTQAYFNLFRQQAWFGLTTTLLDSIVLAAFVAVVLALVLGVAARLGTAALCAGLLPVALGYLVAHYFTFLLVDGQRIVHALNDPLQRGDNFLPLDLGFHEPELLLPTAIVWTIQLAAVVGGHVLGAWAGHSALGERQAHVGAMNQLPLAALMVLLTSVTLWSLGQAVIIEPHAALAPQVGPTADVAGTSR